MLGSWTQHHERISFLPFTSRQNLWNLFQNYDAIVIPTKYIEAFSLTAIEAQMYGLPVFYSKISGLIEVIGSSGIAFEANNPYDLSNKLREKFDKINDDKYNELVIKSITNARKYDIKNTINSLINNI